MSIRIVSNASIDNHDINKFDTDDSSKGSTSAGIDNSRNNNNVSHATATIGTAATRESKKRSNEASLSADEVERLEAKRAYNRECASRARQRGKDLIAQLEKQVKDLHDDKSELRRTVAAMEKRLKLLQRENEFLLGTQAISSYDNLVAGKMSENGAIPPTQLPFPPGIRSTNLNAATMTMNGAPYLGHNLFY